MRQTPPLPLAALASNLQRLCWIRLIVSVFLLLASLYAWLELDIADRMPWILLVISAGLALTIFCFLRLKAVKAISELEFFLNLVSDVLLLSLLIYLTGGATNPFVSYFLVPLSIAAATLPWLYAIAIAVLEISAYTLLLFFYLTLPFFSHGGGDAGHLEHVGYNAHYLGMWFNFFVSAALIAWFVAKMAENLRTQEEQLQRQQQQRREQQLHDEQILSIASLAAGTAHELGTPINSLKLLISELEQNTGNLDETTREDISLMQTQIDECEASLKKLVSTAQQTQPGNIYRQPVGAWLLQCVQRWQPLRPDVTVTVSFTPEQFPHCIQCDDTLQQAVVNLLNNAANASPQGVDVNLQLFQQAYARIIISDQGPGIDAGILASQDRGIVRRSEADQRPGLGLGIFLSNASINRLGGELILNNRVDGQSGQVCGAEVIVMLPLSDEKTDS